MKKWICEEVPAVKLNGEVVSTMLHKTQELVPCKDCIKRYTRFCPDVDSPIRADDWFCADGERRTE